MGNDIRIVKPGARNELIGPKGEIQRRTPCSEMVAGTIIFGNTYQLPRRPRGNRKLSAAKSDE